MILVDIEPTLQKLRERQSKIASFRGGYKYLPDEEREEFDRIDRIILLLESIPEIEIYESDSWED